MLYYLHLWICGLENCETYSFTKGVPGLEWCLWYTWWVSSGMKEKVVQCGTSAWSTPPTLWSMWLRSAWFQRTHLRKNLIRTFFLGILLTEKGSFTSGRNVRDDHRKEDHHRHHRCDSHCDLCISLKNIPCLVWKEHKMFFQKEMYLIPTLRMYNKGGQG